MKNILGNPDIAGQKELLSWGLAPSAYLKVQQIQL
jgi:hypothetical protein